MDGGWFEDNTRSHPALSPPLVQFVSRAYLLQLPQFPATVIQPASTPSLSSSGMDLVAVEEPRFCVQVLIVLCQLHATLMPCNSGDGACRGRWQLGTSQAFKRDVVIGSPRRLASIGAKCAQFAVAGWKEAAHTVAWEREGERKSSVKEKQEEEEEEEEEEDSSDDTASASINDIRAASGCHGNRAR
ncbi:hypothetical protein INR49_012295 [Caranx melampygus]|nr:hypothetical protein INR49_012295 [Caranx melampygus]